MRALLAIVKQTVRSSLRSHVFHVLLGLTLLAVILLPLTVSGDGTAKGELQIVLTYSLGTVMALVSAATLWVACAVLAREIEAYHLHLVVTKPAAPWLIWTGKWLGIFLMNAFILTIAYTLILGIVLWRANWGKYPPDQMELARSEVLVGRRAFLPEQPDFTQIARLEYERRLTEGSLAAGHNPETVMEEILRQVKAKSQEVPPGATRFWVFRNVRIAKPEDRLYLRYRYYIGGTSRSGQRFTQELWGVRVPDAEQEGTFAVVPQQAMSGTFHELVLTGTAVDGEGRVVITYNNQDQHNESLVFQAADGPQILVRGTGFVANYARSFMLGLFQLALMAALGCTVGAAFSTPVAVFVAVAYLMTGMFVQSAVNAPLMDEQGNYQYKTVIDRVVHYIAIATSKVVVSVEELDASSDLARGRLVELPRLFGAAFHLVLFRGGLMAALGVWILSKRELGRVIRK